MADPSLPQEPAEPSPPEDLKTLAEGLRRARGDEEPDDAGTGRARSREMGMAVRMATELAAAVAVGGFLGWYLDKWLGTSPWLLLVLLMLGMVSGTLTAFRLSKRVGTDAQD